MEGHSRRHGLRSPHVPLEMGQAGARHKGPQPPADDRDIVEGGGQPAVLRAVHRRHQARGRRQGALRLHRPGQVHLRREGWRRRRRQGYGKGAYGDNIPDCTAYGLA